MRLYGKSVVRSRLNLLRTVIYLVKESLKLDYWYILRLFERAVYLMEYVNDLYRKNRKCTTDSTNANHEGDEHSHASSVSLDGTLIAFDSSQQPCGKQVRQEVQSCIRA